MDCQNAHLAHRFHAPGPSRALRSALGELGPRASDLVEVYEDILDAAGTSLIR